MAFEKGKSGNPQGKPKGTKNKINADLRKRITDFLNGEFETITEDFRNLEPKDKLKFYTDILNYGLPKLQTTSLEVDFESMSEDQLDYIIEQLKQSEK